MSIYKRLFMEYMDEKGIKYSDTGEFTVRIVYSGDNLNSIPVVVGFDKDGEGMVEFKCFDILNLEGKEAEGIQTCNKLNSYYRWVKYFVDDDSDVICDADAYIDTETGAEVCMNMVRRVVNITDEAYKDFVKIKFGF